MEGGALHRSEHKNNLDQLNVLCDKNLGSSKELTRKICNSNSASNRNFLVETERVSANGSNYATT
jgi:5S rRNA maturation endonuclease (ribonuclease M5)